MKKDRSRLWDASLVAGGVILGAVTLKSYRSFDAPAGPPRQNKQSPREADNNIESITSFLKSNPEDFNAWSQLAIAYYYKGPDAYADGINAVEKARALGGTSESLFYYAGVMYEKLGLPEYAANELSKYLRHYPEDYETKVRLANLYAAQKKWEESLRLYQSLTKQWPRDATVWFNYAVASKDKGDLDGALSCFKRVREIAKELPEGGLYQEGEVYRLKGDDTQAVSLFQQELVLHPDFLPALIALESAQKRKALWKDARETRNKITELKAKQSTPSK